MKTTLSRVACVALLTLIATAVAVAQAPRTTALQEDDVVKLLELQIGDAVILGKVQKDGLAFELDDPAVERLKAAGASEDLLAGLQKAAAKPAGEPGAITYQDIVRLLELSIPEASILERLEKSPTVFVLDETQTAELKQLGASDKLLEALQGRRAPAEGEPPISDLAIILDCSRSMQEKTKEGATKMEAAKEVVNKLVQSIPNGLRVSFVIYGHDRKLACKAVKVARPIGELDDAGKAELAKLISSLQPIGDTPIALALETAGKQLAENDAYCGIVLITDGVDTCRGNPTAVAAQLARNPKLSFGVNVVGFGLNPQEQKSVESIATAGKGKYYNAQSTQDLMLALAELGEQVQRVAKPAPVKTKGGRRAVKIVKPSIELPALARVVLSRPGQAYYVVASDIGISGQIDKYDQEIRVPSDEKFDLWFFPKQGHPVLMIKDFSLPEREVKEVKPEEHLGIVRVSGEGQPKPEKIVVSRNDASAITVENYQIQVSTEYGQDMVVPAGTYHVWVKPAGENKYTQLEKDLEVAAGEVTLIE